MIIIKKDIENLINESLHRLKSNNTNQNKQSHWNEKDLWNFVIKGEYFQLITYLGGNNIDEYLKFAGNLLVKKGKCIEMLIELLNDDRVTISMEYCLFFLFCACGQSRQIIRDSIVSELLSPDTPELVVDNFLELLEISVVVDRKELCCWNLIEYLNITIAKQQSQDIIKIGRHMKIQAKIIKFLYFGGIEITIGIFKSWLFQLANLNICDKEMDQNDTQGSFEYFLQQVVNSIQIDVIWQSVVEVLVEIWEQNSRNRINGDSMSFVMHRFLQTTAMVSLEANRQTSETEILRQASLLVHVVLNDTNTHRTSQWSQQQMITSALIFSCLIDSECLRWFDVNLESVMKTSEKIKRMVVHSLSIMKDLCPESARLLHDHMCRLQTTSRRERKEVPIFTDEFAIQKVRGIIRCCCKINDLPLDTLRQIVKSQPLFFEESMLPCLLYSTQWINQDEKRKMEAWRDEIVLFLREERVLEDEIFYSWATENAPHLLLRKKRSSPNARPSNRDPFRVFESLNAASNPQSLAIILGQWVDDYSTDMHQLASIIFKAGDLFQDLESIVSVVHDTFSKLGQALYQLLVILISKHLSPDKIGLFLSHWPKPVQDELYMLFAKSLFEPGVKTESELCKFLRFRQPQLPRQFIVFLYWGNFRARFLQNPASSQSDVKDTVRSELASLLRGCGTGSTMILESMEMPDTIDVWLEWECAAETNIIKPEGSNICRLTKWYEACIRKYEEIYGYAIGCQLLHALFFTASLHPIPAVMLLYVNKFSHDSSIVSEYDVVDQCSKVMMQTFSKVSLERILDIMFILFENLTFQTSEIQFLENHAQICDHIKHLDVSYQDRFKRLTNRFKEIV